MLIFRRIPFRPSVCIPQPSRTFSSSSARASIDPFDVLGVSRLSSNEEIKHRFRELAKKYHPDLNKSPDASAKMAEIATAYDTLTDPVKRAQLDGTSSTSSSTSSSSSYAHDTASMFSDFSNIFGRMSSSTRSSSQSMKGEDVSATLEISLEQAVQGVVQSLSVKVRTACSSCGGSGCRPGTSPSSCRTCKGAGVQRVDRGIMTMGLPCVKCAGSGSVIEHPCGVCRGDGVKLQPRDVVVKVPAGVRHFMELRVPGQGHCGSRGGRTGDLFVTVKVKPHEKFRVIDEDIHCDVKLRLKDALLGGEVLVPLLDSSNQKVVVPARTLPGSLRVLKGRGPPKIGGVGNGDLVVHFTLDVAQNLTERQKRLIEEFDSIERESRM